MKAAFSLPARHALLPSEVLAALERGATVLVPNRRVAHALGHAYAKHQVTSGKQAWTTPTLFTLQAWLERLWTARERDDSGRVLLSSVQTRRAWQQLVEASSWAKPLLAPTSAATASLRSYEIMRRWQLPLAAVAAFDTAEAQALVAWIATFENLCASRNWITPLSLAQVLMQADGIPGEDVVLVGYDQPRPEERDLCACIERRGGRVTQVLRQSHEGRRGIVGAMNAEDELLQAAHWARAQWSAGAGAIGIVVPHLDRVGPQISRVFADVFHPVMRTLEHAGEQPGFTLAAAQPLAEFPIVSAALDLLELAAGEAPSTLAGTLLRSPFLAGAEAEQSMRALADARLRQEGRELFDLGALERLAEANDCTTLSLGLRAVRLMMDERARAPSEWSNVFVSLWRTIGWPGERTATSDEQQTIAKLHEVLGDFGTLNGLLGSLSYRRAAHEFAQLVKQTQFEPRSPAAPVTIVSQEDARGMQFDALWVAGMDATNWPPPAEPDAFIPLPLQLRAGIPEASPAGMRAKFTERFLDLSAAANDIVFSWARMDEDVELDPSPCIAQLAPANASSSAPSTGYRHTLFQHRAALEQMTDLSAPPLRETRVRGGTRIAELTALCPFRAQTELRLRAAPLARVSPALDPLERGQLTHEVLSAFWAQVGSRDALLNLSADMRRDKLRSLLHRLSAQLLQGASPHRARLVAIELAVAEDKLMELLALEAARTPFNVYREPELKAERRIAGLDVQVRFDRIDELPDGRRVVIDYKTGSSASAAKWWGERPEQPQLPLYAVLESEHLAAVTFAQLGAGKVGFEGVARESGILPGIAAYPGANGAPPERLDWQRLIAYWREVIERLFTRYASGDAAVDPLPQACRYCHLSMLCRIHELRALATETGDV